LNSKPNICRNNETDEMAFRGFLLAARRKTSKTPTLHHLMRIIDVAQCFLPRVEMRLPPQTNESFTTASVASFDIGKKHCGVLRNVKRHCRTKVGGWISAGSKR
jgi:hypothetical protein